MKRLLLVLSLLWLVLPAQAASRITATVTVTNATITNGSTIVVNASSRLWTNTVVNSVTQIAISNSIQQNASNLFNQIAANPYTGPLIVQQPATNYLTLIGQIDQALVITLGGTWGSVSYATSSVALALTVRVPFTVEAASNQVTIASTLVSNIFNLGLSTNLIASGSTAMTNFVNISGAQGIGGAKVFSNAVTVNGLQTNMTGGTLSNFLVLGGTNQGVVIGSGTISGNASLVTNGTYFTPTFTNAVNRGVFQAYNEDSRNVEIGSGSSVTASATGGTAVGYQAVAGQTGVAIGRQAQSGGYTASTALGYLASNTANNQIMLGTSSETVHMPGSARIVSSLVVQGSLTATNPTLVGGSFIGTFGGAITSTNILNKGTFQTYRNDRRNVEIGTNAAVTAPFVGSVSIGADSAAAGEDNVSVGNAAITSNDRSVSIGSGAQAGSALGRSTAVGYGAIASGYSATAIGYSADATQEYSTALGRSAQATGTNSTAVGTEAVSAFANSTALGASATVTANNQIMIGTASETMTAPGSAKVGGNLNVGSLASPPSGLTAGIYITNGTGATADPVGAAVWSAGGELEYRASASDEGAGQTNRVHNRLSSVVGSGGNYSLTTTLTNAAFGGTNPVVTLPTPGTYLLTFTGLLTAGASANDSYWLQLYDNTANAYLTPYTVNQTSVAGSVLSMNGIVVATVTSSRTITLHAYNATAARGTLLSTGTFLNAVRLY